MEKVLTWTQGGQNYLIFARNIIMIVENEHKTCDIHLIELEPIQSSLSLSEIRKQLDI